MDITYRYSPCSPAMDQGHGKMLLSHLVALSCFLSLRDTHFCEGKFVQIETNNVYNHQFVPDVDLRDASSIAFTVKTCSNAIVSLQASFGAIDNNAFEIVIGGWTNSRSVIRKGLHYANTELAAFNSAMTSCSETRDFWISWSDGIQVGKGTIANTNVFLKANVQLPYTALAMSVTSWQDDKGSWSIAYGSGKSIKIETPNAYNHQIVQSLDIKDSTSITFEVMTCSNAIVSLQPYSSITYSRSYEIVIGGWLNTASVIRSGFHGVGTDLATHRSAMTSCTETRQFWISWSDGVKVGTGSVVNRNIFLNTKEQPPYAVVALSVTSWTDDKGSWLFRYGSGDVRINTGNVLNYYPLLNYDLTGGTSLKFSVMACNDVTIRLEPAKGVAVSSTYEFVIGGWSNTRSVLRKGGLEYVAVGGAPVDCQSHRSLWISWASGTIRLGAGSNVAGPFLLTYADTTYPVGGVSVYTAWGATGNWVFRI